MSGPDILFTLRNNFYLGAYQAAIAEAADLERLSESDAVERDCFVYRAYIELGSFEVGKALDCRHCIDLKITLTTPCLTELRVS